MGITRMNFDPEKTRLGEVLAALSPRLGGTHMGQIAVSALTALTEATLIEEVAASLPPEQDEAAARLRLIAECICGNSVRILQATGMNLDEAKMLGEYLIDEIAEDARRAGS